MELVVIESAAKQGIWAVLFISLYFYQLKEGRRRESESQAREAQLTSSIREISTQYEGLVLRYQLLAEEIKEMKNELSDNLKSSVSVQEKRSSADTPTQSMTLDKYKHHRTI